MADDPTEFSDYWARRALRRAAEDGRLPDDPGLLARYHGLAADLLAMMANRVEPTWDFAEAACAEIDRLLSLQSAILARIADQPARRPDDILLKLRLWSLARATADEAQAEDCLVRSAIQDLERLLDTAAIGAERT